MQPVADNASHETLLANGMSAVHNGDTATASKMLDALAAKPARRPRRPPGRMPTTAARPPAPAAGGACRRRRRGLASCITSWRR